jgi:hypothetical protein
MILMAINSYYINLARCQPHASNAALPSISGSQEDKLHGSLTAGSLDGGI